MVEVIAIDMFDFVGVGFGDTDVVLDHEIGKSGPIDQDYFLRDFPGIGDRGVSKLACGDAFLPASVMT